MCLQLQFENPEVIFRRQILFLAVTKTVPSNLQVQSGVVVCDVVLTPELRSSKHVDGRRMPPRVRLFHFDNNILLAFLRDRYQLPSQAFFELYTVTL